MGNYIYKLNGPKKCVKTNLGKIATIQFACREGATTLDVGKGGYPVDAVSASVERAWDDQKPTRFVVGEKGRPEDFSTVYERDAGCLTLMYDTPSYPHDRCLGFIQRIPGIRARAYQVVSEYYEVSVGEKYMGMFQVSKTLRTTNLGAAIEFGKDPQFNHARISRFFINSVGKVRVESVTQRAAA